MSETTRMFSRHFKDDLLHPRGITTGAPPTYVVLWIWKTFVFEELVYKFFMFFGGVSFGVWGGVVLAFEFLLFLIFFFFFQIACRMFPSVMHKTRCMCENAVG